MIQKTKVKKEFNKVGIQVSVETLNLLEEEIKRIISHWVKNAQEGNVKRLSADIVWIALGKWNSEK